MDPLTLDALRTAATERGLTLTDAELAALLPIVNANRALLATLPPLTDGEPASQYRIL